MAYPNMLGVPRDAFNDGRNIEVSNDMYMYTLGANSVLVLDSSKKIVSSIASNTLEHLSGVTSNIQTQLNVLSGDVDDIFEDVSDLVGTVSGHTDDIGSLQSTVGGHTTDIGNLQNAVSDLENDMPNKLESDIDVQINTRDIMPDTQDTYNIGAVDLEYNNIYANTIHGTVAGGSDSRLKKNIKDCNLGLEFIRRLKPRQYQYKKRSISDVQRVGLIAQEVQEVLYQYEGFDDEKRNGFIHGYGDDGMLSLSYTEFITPLILAVQELSIEVKKLKKEVKKLSE